MEYLSTHTKISKWTHQSPNISVVVVLIEDGMVPTKWPLARVTKTYSGERMASFVLLISKRQRVLIADLLLGVSGNSEWPGLLENTQTVGE